MTHRNCRHVTVPLLACALVAAFSNCDQQTTPVTTTTPSTTSATLSTTTTTTATAMVTTATPITAATLRNVTAYPQATIANDSVKLTVYLPGESGFYRGPRFDWSGMISRVEYRGHTLFAPRHTPHVPTLQDMAFGTAEEFGMDTALNFDQVEPGQPFLKIGVGAMVRPASGRYDFQKEYPVVTPAPWTSRSGDEFVESTQTQAVVDGWGYQYVKRIELLAGEPGWVVIRTLSNAGTHEINTAHYCHNFLVVDDQPIGPGYSIEYPAVPQIPKNALTQDSISVRGNAIGLDKPLVAGKPVWAPLGGLVTGQLYHMILREASTGLELDIRGDRPLTKAVLYAETRCLCPEAFIDLRVSPGQSQEWRTEYRLKIGK
jgi:hypothetical protein